MVELLFNDHNVTMESCKYAALTTIISKDKRVLAKVTDILQHLNKINPYSQFKKALIKRFAVNHNDSLRSLPYDCDSGKGTVFEFYCV